MSLDSFGLAWVFSGTRGYLRVSPIYSRAPSGRRVLPGSGAQRGSREFTTARLGIIGFIRFRVVSLGRS